MRIIAEIGSLSITDASNIARFPELQAPSTVNNGARGLEGIIARWNFDSVEGTINSAGGTTAYTVAANRTLSAYYDGMRQGFHVNATNTGAVTLNIDSVGAKAVKKNADKALVAGDWITDQYVEVVYSATDDTFQMVSPVALESPTLTADNAFTGTNTNTAQPAFLAVNSATDSDVTGDGTTVTVEFDTEIFDQGSDFNTTTDTFTAPATGRYQLTVQIRYVGLTTGDTVNLTLRTSNRDVVKTTVGETDASGTGNMTLTAIVDMDASDTAFVQFTITGVGADTADIFGNAAPHTYFSGCLLV